MWRFVSLLLLPKPLKCKQEKTWGFLRLSLLGRQILPRLEAGNSITYFLPSHAIILFIAGFDKRCFCMLGTIRSTPVAYRGFQRNSNRSVVHFLPQLGSLERLSPQLAGQLWKLGKAQIGMLPSKVSLHGTPLASRAEGGVR